MTTELWMLVASAGLLFVLNFVLANAVVAQRGMPWALGNRDEPGAPLAPWMARGGRAVENLKENLLVFAILVLVVHVAGASNSTSALGAQIFLGARVVHALSYLGGVKVVRTLAWAGGMVGTVMVGVALV
jgi:uncharacterized MAPEG superfamily protein